LGPEGEEFRANDDGEPSGTAGRPILGQLQSFGLTNVLVVVIRYFGGILLGSGGLVVAYKSAASEALASAQVVEKTVDADFEFRFEFPYMNDVMRIVKNMEARIVEQGYETDCLMRLRIRKSEAERLEGALSKVETLTFV
jgi:putative IMPACT (imprinted ancient) family translation regulator